MFCSVNPPGENLQNQLKTQRLSLQLDSHSARGLSPGPSQPRLTVTSLYLQNQDPPVVPIRAEEINQLVQKMQIQINMKYN